MPDLLSILFSALSEPVGVLVWASDPALARARLYAARAKNGDPALARLQIRLITHPEGNIVIVKGPTNGEEI